MQNKAKVKIGKMNISIATTKHYDKNNEQSTTNVIQNKPNSKPIGEDQYKTKDPRHKTKDTSLESEVWGLKSGRKGKIDAMCVLTKDYENKPRLRAPGKQTQSNRAKKVAISVQICYVSKSEGSTVWPSLVDRQF